MSGLSARMTSALESSSPWFIACANPTFAWFAMRRTHGKRSVIAATVPSPDALSTTMTSAEGTVSSAASDSRQVISTGRQL